MNKKLKEFNKQYHFVMLYDKAVRNIREQLNASIWTKDNKKIMFYKYQLNCFISHLKNRYNLLIDSYKQLDTVPNEIIHKMMSISDLGTVGDYCL